MPRLNVGWLVYFWHVRKILSVHYYFIVAM
nr:MAG TPA: hypothetical protein [Caudoviricetes sp.]